MCLAVGVHFACQCTWRNWIECGQSACQVKSFKQDGLPPPLISGHGTNQMLAYGGFAKQYQTFMKVKWCCGPRCCEMRIQGSVRLTPDSYRKQIHHHWEVCLPQATNRLGMLNCMRDDLGKEHRKDELPRVDFGPLTHMQYQSLPHENAIAYQEAMDRYGGLQSNVLDLGWALNQYKIIRAYVLENPQLAAHSLWRPSQELVNTYNHLKTIFGDGSTEAAQAGFGEQMKQRCIFLLDQMRHVPTPLDMSAPTAQQLTSATGSTPACATQPPEFAAMMSRRPELTNSLYVQAAIDKVKAKADNLHDLPPRSTSDASQRDTLAGFNHISEVYAARKNEVQFLQNELQEIGLAITWVPAFTPRDKETLTALWLSADDAVTRKSPPEERRVVTATGGPAGDEQSTLEVASETLRAFDQEDRGRTFDRSARGSNTRGGTHSRGSSQGGNDRSSIQPPARTGTPPVNTICPRLRATRPNPNLTRRLDVSGTKRTNSSGSEASFGYQRTNSNSSTSSFDSLPSHDTRPVDSLGGVPVRTNIPRQQSNGPAPRVPPRTNTSDSSSGGEERKGWKGWK